MADLVVGDVTTALTQHDRHVLGSIKLNHATLSFGDAAKTYPRGGIPVPTVASLGLNKEVIDLQVADISTGIRYSYDKTNHKLRAFAPAPPIVFEELVNCGDDVAYLKYPAAFIMYVGSADTFHKVVSGKYTPATGQVAVDLFSATPGRQAKLTFPANEGAVATYVTYVTQAWKDVFDNLVEDEPLAIARFTAGTPDKWTLANLACAIQNVTWNDAATIKAMVAAYTGVDPATNEVAIDFVDTADTSLKTREEDTLDTDLANGYFTYVTYIKKPTTGFLIDRFVEEEDLTPSTDVITIASPTVDELLLFGTCGSIPGVTAAPGNLIRSGGTLGTTATLAKLTASKFLTGVHLANTITFGSGHADTDHQKPSYIFGQAEEIAPLMELELKIGTIVRPTVLRCMVWGR